MGDKNKYIFISDRESKKSVSYLFCKRVIDIIGSLAGLILLSPVFLLVSIALKLESPKSKVIFVQRRNGKYAKEFDMYKFRSMVANAENMLYEVMEDNEADGPVFKMKNDPRITKVGKFIRKTSIDELPQLVNVLKGDMSLVGPRPPIPHEVKQYTNHHMKRLSIKPGLTCYWQVCARHSVTFEEWIDLDIKYIKERSLLVDIKLILKTILVLFGDKNAC